MYKSKMYNRKKERQCAVYRSRSQITGIFPNHTTMHRSFNPLNSNAKEMDSVKQSHTTQNLAKKTH